MKTVKRSAQHEVALVAGGAVQICGANNDRSTIVIGSGDLSQIIVGPFASANFGHGFRLAPHALNLVLCCCDYGDFVKGAIFAVAPDGNETILVVETFGDEGE